VTQADELLGGVSGDFFIGDRAYDKQGFVESIHSRGGKVRLAAVVKGKYIIVRVFTR